MAINIREKSWYIKYQPKEVNDLIFDNDEFKELVLSWIQNEEIDGNVLFYGPPGLGKTATAEIVISAIVKAQNDLLYTKETGVAYIDEQVKPYIKSRPMRSKKKIVYMEEFDRLKSEAQNSLKKDTMEKFQNNVSFVCCTNWIKRIEPALLSRFNYKISFNGTNIQGMIDRLLFILTNENAKFDNEQLSLFVKKNHKIGMREMINMLQNSFRANNGTITFKDMHDSASIEEQILKLIFQMLSTISSIDIKNRRMCYDLPDNSPIKEDYKTFITLLHNNNEINYDVIYNRLINQVSYVPIKLIIGKYADQQEYRMFPHLNLIACWYEMMKSISEINKW